MAEKLYIAETNGDVECVWMTRSNGRKVMTFNPKTHRFDSTEPAECSGARKNAIVSWLAAAQQTKK